MLCRRGALFRFRTMTVPPPESPKHILDGFETTNVMSVRVTLVIEGSIVLEGVGVVE